MTATLNRTEIVRMTIAVDPTSLGGIDQASYVDAVEAELSRAYPNCDVTVEFAGTVTGDRVSSVATTGEDVDSQVIEEDIAPMMNRAFAACCRAE